MHSAVTAIAREMEGNFPLVTSCLYVKERAEMVQLNKDKSNMIDCMGKYYLKQIVFLVLYIKNIFV